MNHCRQENAAKFAVHCTETGLGSCAVNLELLCARNTFESSAESAERKVFHALWFLLYRTHQSCYLCEISLTARVVVVRTST